jgi:hypothetical protein
MLVSFTWFIVIAFCRLGAEAYQMLFPATIQKTRHNSSGIMNEANLVMMTITSSEVNMYVPGHSSNGKELA